jgi:hypothetical protein
MGGGSSFPAPDKALQLACKKGNAESAKKAIADGANINGASPQFPIILAAYNGHADVLAVLLAIEELDKDVCSPM